MQEDILYSLCWEDQEIIPSLIAENANILLVASAGCTTLSALTKRPSRCIVVDTNADQLELLNLKLEAFRRLSYTDMTTLMGCFPQDDSERRAQVMQQLTENLPRKTGHWVKEQPALIERGLLRSGRFEQYVHFFVRRLLPLAVSRSTIAAFLDCSTLEQQKQLYANRIDNWRYRLLFKGFFAKFYMARKGRHPDLLQHVKVNPATVFYERMKHAWTHVPIQENYFFRFILEGVFRKELNKPEWMEVGRFELIGSQVDRVEQVRESVIDYLNRTVTRNLDLIYLSDIAEAMSPQESKRLFDVCYEALKDNGRMVLWNNLVDRTPDQRWELDKPATQKAWESRLISFYGALGIYKKRSQV